MSSARTTRRLCRRTTIAMRRSTRFIAERIAHPAKSSANFSSPVAPSLRAPGPCTALPERQILTTLGRGPMASKALDQRQPLSAEAGSSALPAANRLEFVDNLRWGKDLPTEAHLALPSDGQLPALALRMGICSFLGRIVQPTGTN